MPRFETTPDEAQTLAGHVHDHLQKEMTKCEVEVPFDEDAPLTTTLMGVKKEQPVHLVEVQAHASYSQHLERLSQYLRAHRAYAKLSIATSTDVEIGAQALQRMRRDGVGLMLVSDDGHVDQLIEPTVPALTVTPDPNLALGPAKAAVAGAVARFNRGEHKGALQDICELGEKETHSLIVKAARSKAITKSVAEVEKMDWNAQIEVLGSKNCSTSSEAIISGSLKADLHSFRGARNLVDHKTTSAKAAADREKQFTERMMMGPRVIADVLKARRTIQ